MKHLRAMNTSIGQTSLFFVGLVISGFLTACASGPYIPGQRIPLVTNPEIQHTEYRVRSQDRLSLFAQTWRPQTEARAAVILVHGMKDHSDRYNDIATAMARQGLVVYAFDLRGHGDSEGDREWVNPFEHYLEDLDLFYQKARSELPGRPLFLMGHSLGGTIVTLYTLEKKPEIKGLILSAPALKPGKEFNAFVMGVTGFLGTVAPKMAIFKLDPKAFTRDPEAQKEMEYDKLIVSGKAPARTGKELLRALAQIQDRQAELQTPFLIVHGTEDKLTTLAGSQDLLQKAAAKDKTLKTYPGAYHDLLHDSDRQKVTDDILEWLKERD